MVPSSSGAALVYVLSLVLITVLCLVVLNYVRPTSSEKRWFAQHGKQVMATVEKLDMRAVLSGYIAVYMYRVEARWEDPKTGEVHLALSAWVPRTSLKKEGNTALSRDIVPGEPIKVLIDPRNPEHAMIVGLPPLTYEGSRFFLQ